MIVATVTNLGPSEATGVVVAPSFPHVDSPFSEGCSVVCGFVGLSGRGDLEPGESGAVAVAVEHAPATPISASASVTAATPDPDRANNSSDITITPLPAPPLPTLALDATVTRTEVRPGALVSYVFTVQNQSDQPAEAVQLTGPKLDGDLAQLVAVVASQGTCDSDAACSFGTLAPRGTATATLTYRVLHVGFGQLVAYAGAGTADLPNPWGVGRVPHRGVRAGVRPRTAST